MKIVVSPGGTTHCVYGETIDLTALGSPMIVRASHVEPTPDGHWTADMRPIDGPVLGPFDRRSDALAAELRWIEEHWLLSGH